MSKVFTTDGAEGARVELVNPSKPPVAAIARDLTAEDLPPDVVLTPILPGQILGLQIDAPLPALPVALTGLEVGENLRFRTNQTHGLTGGPTTLALNPETNVVTKTGGTSVIFSAWTGGESGRIVLLKHTSGGGSTTTLEHDTGGTDGFLCPGSVPFVFGGASEGGGSNLFAGFILYDSSVQRWIVFPRGVGRAENATWSGSHTFNGSFTVSTPANLSLTAGSQLQLSSTGSLILSTNGVERLEIENDGAWQVGTGLTGTAGQALISAGASAPPAWGLVSQSGLNGGIQASLLGATPTASDTTNLSVGAITVPANTTAVGTTYIANLSVEFVHTASATPTLTLEWVYGGAVVCTRVITVTAVAGTYTLWVEGYFRHTTIGAASGARISIRSVCTAGATVADQIGDTTAAPGGLNTTISRTLELRVRMTTTVASNTITLHQGLIQRLINQ